MEQLVSCHRCARHVRASEGQCPFCNAALRSAQSPARALVRAALAVAVSSTALAGCEPLCARVTVPGMCDGVRREPQPPPPYDPPVDRATVPAYGIAPPMIVDVGDGSTLAIPINRGSPRYGAPPAPRDECEWV
jgi:hypothetical protein